MKKRVKRTKQMGSMSIGKGGTKGGLWGNYLDAHPFPPTLRAKLTYTDNFTLASAAITGNCNNVGTYNLNGLFDVDAGAGGHQPLGFDQLCSANGPYYRYKVIGVEIDVTFVNPSADTATVCCVNIRNPGSAFTLAGNNYSTIAEKQQCVTKFCNKNGNEKVRIKKYFPMHTLINITKSQYDNDMTSFSAQYSANPASIPQCEIGMCNPRAGASDVFAMFKINYTVEFYQRATLGQS